MKPRGDVVMTAMAAMVIGLFVLLALSLTTRAHRGAEDPTSISAASSADSAKIARKKQKLKQKKQKQKAAESKKLQIFEG
jgi:hypothetical protein